MASAVATYDPFATSGTWRRQRAKIVVYVLLTLFAAYYLLPLIVVILNSFRDLEEINRAGLIGLPHSFSLSYWPVAWSSFCVGGTCSGIAPSFWNSVKMVVPATIISTAIGAINGYVLSKWRFKGQAPVRADDARRVHAGADGAAPVGIHARQARPDQLTSGLVLHCVQGLSFDALLPQLLRQHPGRPDQGAARRRRLLASFTRSSCRSPPILIVTVIWQFTNIWNEFLFAVIFPPAKSSRSRRR